MRLPISYHPHIIVLTLNEIQIAEMINISAKTLKMQRLLGMCASHMRSYLFLTNILWGFWHHPCGTWAVKLQQEERDFAKVMCLLSGIDPIFNLGNAIPHPIFLSSAGFTPYKRPWFSQNQTTWVPFIQGKPRLCSAWSLYNLGDPVCMKFRV